MGSDSPNVDPMVSVYKKLFLVLSVVTLIGVAIAVLHVPVAFVIAAGVIFILAKSLIVYESFKKLIAGRGFIVVVFLLTLAFIVVLISLPFFNHENNLVGTKDISKELLMDQKEEGHHGH